MSPEEVYTSMRVAGDSNILPCKWLKTELPLLLDQIRMLVATSSLQSFSDKTPTEDKVSNLLLNLTNRSDYSSVFSESETVLLHRIT